MSEYQEPYEAFIRRKEKELIMGDITNHLIVLKNKHHALDKMIEAMEAERAPDDMIKRKKKEKLKLKEEIVKIEEQIL